MNFLSKVTLKMAVAWGVLFSLNSLGTCIMVALNNTVWVELTAQKKFVLVLGVMVNWTGVILAFVSKTVARLEAGKLPPTNGDTSFLTKDEVPTTTQPTK